MRFILVGLGLCVQMLHAADMFSLGKSEFIYEKVPFPECHASTIAEVNGRMIAAWFGGTREGNKDVCIWLSQMEVGKWSAPVLVVDGIEGDKRYPTWNPVLFQPKGEPLTLFYKVGPSPDRWWGKRVTSTDAARTWSKSDALAAGILGPIKNKPVQLSGGEIISPTSTEHDGWRVHFERSTDGGKTWERTANVADPKNLGAIQPAILVHKDGSLQALCRSKGKRVAETWSRDGGRTWSELRATSLPNPNSGLDALTLQDGRHLLVYNHTEHGRTPLNVALSDDGKTWTPMVVLENEPGEYSYPAVIQAADGRVHVTYTWKRQRIKHAVLAPGGNTGAKR
jgi:predicted neuraminidase